MVFVPHHLAYFIYTMEFYAAERKKELIPLATVWMELESIMLSEISVSFSRWSKVNEILKSFLYKQEFTSIVGSIFTLKNIIF